MGRPHWNGQCPYFWWTYLCSNDEWQRLLSIVVWTCAILIQSHCGPRNSHPLHFGIFSHSPIWDGMLSFLKQIFSHSPIWDGMLAHIFTHYHFQNMRGLAAATFKVVNLPSPPLIERLLTISLHNGVSSHFCIFSHTPTWDGMLPLAKHALTFNRKALFQPTSHLVLTISLKWSLLLAYLVRF